VVRRPTAILSRRPQLDDARRAFEDDLAPRCAAAGWDVLVIPHVYHLAAGDGLWAELAALPGPVALASWMHARPAGCLLREEGVEPAAVIDLGECGDADVVLAALSEALGEVEGAGSVREVERRVAERWYPVIDRARCIACGHCLQFCLFGVYESDDAGQVVTVRPDNCKPGCPACSRICPEGAILFPMCDDPAIAGAPGTLMSPDAAARRMYYVCTGRPCRACGQVARPGGAGEGAGVAICRECGSPLPGAEVTAAQPSAVHDEIDALIEALDEIAGGGGR